MLRSEADSFTYV